MPVFFSIFCAVKGNNMMYDLNLNITRILNRIA